MVTWDDDSVPGKTSNSSSSSKQGSPSKSSGVPQGSTSEGGTPTTDTSGLLELSSSLATSSPSIVTREDMDGVAALVENTSVLPPPPALVTEPAKCVSSPVEENMEIDATTKQDEEEPSGPEELPSNISEMLIGLVLLILYSIVIVPWFATSLDVLIVIFNIVI